MSSPLFPNARAEGSIEPSLKHNEEFNAITLEMWNEFWSEYL
jgi:hypothetical protein